MDTMIDFLINAELLSSSEADLFNKYRDTRNKVIHYLLEQVHTTAFETKLKEACVIGEEIAASRKLASLTKIFDVRETGRVRKTQATYFALKGKKNKAKLNNNQEQVLKLRLEDALSWEDIGARLNFTRERARQLFFDAIEKYENKNGEVPDFTIKLETPKGTDIESIRNEIATQFGISVADILSKSREGKYVLPRHLIMFFLKRKLGISFPKTAKSMNRKDHTTVIHACEQIEAFIEQKKIVITP